VYWNVGSSATLDTTTSFQGNILALTSISMNTGASIGCGSALASTGGVSMQTNTIGSGCGGASGGDLSGGITVPAGGGTPVKVGGGSLGGGSPIGNVPEPETYGLTLAGLVFLGLIRRRRKAAAA
jgi:Ice-binding-like/PEP-CTERM motif